MAKVAFVKTTDRAAGVNRALDLLGTDFVRGKEVFLKPNFNSADRPPGSTHDAVLRTLVGRLQAAGAGPLTVGDRSGMGDTRGVMRAKGVYHLGEELGFRVMAFDDLPADAWEIFRLPGSHWQRGFALPRPVLEAGSVVQACNLKTHRFGGHFTLSLKNSVGLAAKRLPGQSYDYMLELHGSPDQRRMIAEINAAYTPDLVIMDGVEAFVDGGPDVGTLAQPGVVLASADRVAIDAVGVALLRRFGTTRAVSDGPIWEQEQLARAVELGLGAGGPRGVELVTGDRESETYAEDIMAILRWG